VEELVRKNTFVEWFIKKLKQQLEELLQAYKNVFWEPKGLPPKGIGA